MKLLDGHGSDYDCIIWETNHEELARPSRNQNSEFLAQRRKAVRPIGTKKDFSPGRNDNFRTWRPLRLCGRIILSIRNQAQANELSLEKFPKRFVDFGFFLTQVNIGHEQFVLLENLAVARFNVIANRYAPVLVHDFLAFFR